MSSIGAGASSIRAYRIVKRKFANSAFSGTGARRHGGRWNSPGVPVVYASSSIALALLEWRAHLAQWPAPPVAIIEVEFAPKLISVPGRLSKNWRLTPSPKENARIGDTWFASGTSAALKVPSAIVPDEANYLFNPLHPDFRSVLIGKPRLLQIDHRLGPITPT